MSQDLDRRHFLGAAAVAGAAGASWQTAQASITDAIALAPIVRNPRATSGDVRHEPDWADKLTIRVGPADADIVGTTEKTIQAAVDSVARWGGGTVQLLPGIYRLRNAIYLASRVRLAGSGPETILIKEPSLSTRLQADSDWYDQEITLAHPQGFRVGDGVCLRARDPHHNGTTVLKRTLIARSGARFKLDRPLRENLWASGNPTCASLFPILTGENIHDVAIENLTLDGNRGNNENLDGNHAGCIFLQDCRDIVIRNVNARNYNGDGISWQICHDVVVEECHSHNHAGLGLHPGSGSQRPIMRNNRIERNDIGLFFCWGVKFGLAENNTLDENRTGISVGHRDTDNLIVNNIVTRSQRVGVLFRPERGPSFAGHRNTLINNRIVDSGDSSGVAIDVQGGTSDLVFEGNHLRETRGAAQRIGFRIAAEAGAMRLLDNVIEGFATTMQDHRRNRSGENM